MERVFVKVVGFSDAERHALNTLFRLSEGRSTRYVPWAAEQFVAPHLTLIDSESHEALVEFELPSNLGARVVWIGDGTPARAWRSFPRPIDWPAVIAAMDQLFMKADLDLDVGLDLDFDIDLPDPSPAAKEGAPRRALIASADRGERLYIRARMSLADLTHADEAETAADALELARNHRYDVAVVDYALPGKGGWPLLRALAVEQRIALLIVTKDRLTPAEKARMLLGRQPILLEKPVHPVKLTALLSRA